MFNINKMQRTFCVLIIYSWLFMLLPISAEKYKLCVVDGRGGFKKSARYCPMLDKPDSKVECVVGNDRLDCLRRISKGKADFAVFTPEDLVTAANSEIEVLLTNELRYTNDQNEYEVVAVFRNSSGIQSKHDLNDKRFCHPGYGYEADWTRILANVLSFNVLRILNKMYLEASIIPQSCLTQFTITENRIKASSEFFKSACKAGPWVNNPKLDQELKQKYKNLCELCDNPFRCETSDKYWGRRGSLFCLTDGAGDISWARLDDVRLHFGLVPGGTESSPIGYSFLCPDGTTKPLNSTSPCVWVVKPWPVIATKRTVAQDVQQLVSGLKNVKGSIWKTALLNLIETFHLTIKNMEPIEPIETYLERASGFLSANSFTGCHPPRTIRICTTSNLENTKCAWLRESAAVYGIEPDLDCLKADNVTHCIDAVNRSAADLVIVPPDLVHLAKKKYNLKTLFYETVTDPDKYLTVAVTKSGTIITKLEDLKGFKACFPNYDGVAWNTVVYRLRERNLIDSCSDIEGITDFFGSNCIPGLPKSQCDSHVYGGEFGTLRCLLDGKGDVAFLSKNSINDFVASKSENKYSRMKSDMFSVMCESNSEGCHLSWASAGQGLVRSNSSDLWLKDTLDVFLQLDSLFGRNYKSLTTPLQLFGTFNGESDVLFHDKTVRLRNVPTNRNLDVMKRPYDDIIDNEKECKPSSAVPSSFVLELMFVVFIPILL